MEDTLRDCQKSKEQQFVLHLVLILVLMEDTLRVVPKRLQSISTFVLILVLMEDTLREHYVKN